MLLYAYLVHPFAGSHCFQMGCVKAFARIVVPNPHRGGPKASAELDGAIELLRTAVLSVMGHLQIVAVQVLGIRTAECQVATLHARIAQKDKRLPFVPDAHDHGIVVIGICGELSGNAQNLEFHPVEVEHLSCLLYIHDFCITFAELVIEVSGLLGFRWLGINHLVRNAGVVDSLYFEVLHTLLQDFPQSAHVVVVRMRDEPSLHLVSQSPDETAQSERFFRITAVHHDDFSRFRLEDIRVADSVAVRRNLPNRESRALRSLPCLAFLSPTHIDG